ncbi:MAG: hypothetical protein MJ072_06400, partial [Clostridia bacterium]|nr:hypothetical protein [Clostridia bacterium]
MAIILVFAIALFLPFDGQRAYMLFVNFTKYIFSVKHYSTEHKKSQTNIEFFIPFKDIKDGFIIYEEYKAGVLQVDPREFELLSDFRQDQMIDEYFGRIIRAISGRTRASIVKVDKKLDFHSYIEQEKQKKEEIYKLFDMGELTKAELDGREKVINDRIRIYTELTSENPVKKPFYYFIVYDENPDVITDILTDAIETFMEIGMSSHILNDRELGVFLKYNYTENFEASDIDMLYDEEFLQWVIPHDIVFKPFSTFVDGEECMTYTVKNFPLSVDNAWGF